VSDDGCDERNLSEVRKGFGDGLVNGSDTTAAICRAIGSAIVLGADFLTCDL